MKSAIRVGTISVLIYTLAVSWFMFGALSKAPSDSVIFIMLSALPTSLLTKLIDFNSLAKPVASLLHQPLTDHIVVRIEAITAWLFGCIQYGIVGALIGKIWHAVRAGRA
jgi:hypothetical protein